MAPGDQQPGKGPGGKRHERPERRERPGGGAQQARPPAREPVDPVVHAIGKLQKRFPAAFPKKPEPKVPLKVGMLEDLLPHAEQLGLTAAEIREAIATWCRGSRYWSCLTDGAARVDLNGAPAGQVNARDVAFARNLQRGAPRRPRAEGAGAAKAAGAAAAPAADGVVDGVVDGVSDGVTDGVTDGVVAGATAEVTDSVAGLAADATVHATDEGKTAPEPQSAPQAHAASEADASPETPAASQAQAAPETASAPAVSPEKADANS